MYLELNGRTIEVQEIDPTLTIARAANEYTIRVTRGNQCT